MFIKRSDKIAITADGVVDESAITPEMDVIWIRPKMDFGTRSDFIDLMNKNDRSAGAASIALAELNIVAWQGPSFVDVPLSPANIRALDQDESIVIKAMEAINTRNTPKADDPNSETSNDDG